MTGASSGMGRALALRYADRGCHIVVVARRLERLDQLVESAAKRGNMNVVAVQTDVSEEE